MTATDGQSTPGQTDETVEPVAVRLDPLTARVLCFEREWTPGQGAKERLIRDSLGISPTRYFQVLNQAIDSAGPWSVDPGLVHRLRRRRAGGRAARAAR